MKQVKLCKKISLTPKDLNTNVEECVYNKAVSVFKNSCTKNIGYILDIEKNIKILDNEISSGGLIIFNVEMTAQTLKPFVGQEIDGTVCVIFEEGVFLEVQFKMKVLIPSNRLENYTFNKSSGGFFQRDKQTIKKGDLLTVIIKQIKYDNKGFNCIADLKNQK